MPFDRTVVVKLSTTMFEPLRMSMVIGWPITFEPDAVPLMTTPAAASTLLMMSSVSMKVLLVSMVPISIVACVATGGGGVVTAIGAA